MESGVLSHSILFFLDFPLVYDLTCAGVRERATEREREARESGKREATTTTATASVYDVTFQSSVGRSGSLPCVVHFAGVVAFRQVEFFK